MKKSIQMKTMAAVCLGLSVMTAKAQTVEWAGKYGGIGEDVVRELFVDPVGNVYTTGYFTDVANFAVTGSPVNLTSNGFFDVFVQKTDASGNLVWARSFGSDSFEYGTAIVADASGNVYVSGVFDAPTDFDPGAGVTTLTSNGGQDIFVVKLDASGNFVWAMNVGGAEYDESTALGVDASGNLYLSGYFNATADFDPGMGTYEFTCMGANDNVIAKYSPDGDLIWAKHYGSPDFDAALAMRVTEDGTSYITGLYNGTVDFDPGPGTFEMTGSPMQNSGYLLQLDADGEFMMARNIAGSGAVTSYDVEVDANGNIYLAGNFNGTVDLDPGAGTHEYTSLFDNGFVVKLDAAGDFVWAKNIESSETVIVYSVDVNASGYVTLSGYMETTADFDPDPSEVFELGPESENAMGAYICVYDNDGNFVHAAGYGGATFADYHGAYSDANDNLYISGAFETTVDLNPNPYIEQQVSADDFRDNYLIKLAPIHAGVSKPDPLTQVMAFPNPSSDKVTLSVEGSTKENEPFVVEDNTGRKVMAGTLTDGKAYLDVSGLANGVYTVRISGKRTAALVKN